jgi:hypothetical protein
MYIIKTILFKTRYFKPLAVPAAGRRVEGEKRTGVKVKHARSCEDDYGGEFR